MSFLKVFSCLLITSSILTISFAQIGYYSYSDPDFPEKKGYLETFNTRDCKGPFDKEAFTKVDRVCEDCYYQFRKNFIYDDCIKKCYYHEYFNACMATLQYNTKEEIDEMNELRKKLNTPTDNSKPEITIL